MNKVKNWIRRILLVVCICVFCYSAYNLISIYLDYKKIDDDYGKIESTYVKETETKEGQAYLDIDWDSLLKRNSDVKAWIQIPDTKVNYPVLQGETNDTYKTLNTSSIGAITIQKWKVLVKFSLLITNFANIINQLSHICNISQIWEQKRQTG